MEEFSRRPAQSVNRQITREDDGHRIEDRTIDIFCCGKNDFVQRVLLSFPQGQFAIDVFDHHHCAVDDNAKINRTDGKQISRNVVRMEDDESKQQREWNGESNNDGSAKAHQEENQHHQDKHHAAKQVRFHRVGGQRYQFAAVIVRMNLDVRRQNLPVQFLSFCFHALENVLCLLPPQHENHALDGVVVFLETEFA